MRKVRNLSALLIGSVVVLFASCSFFKENDVPEAQIPVITSITPDTTTLMNIQKDLSVTVEVSDKGTLTYQWYVAESKLSKGTAIENANAQSFTPPVTEVGTLYYYCIIKNQVGESTRSVISPLITYIVKENISAQMPVIIEEPTAQALEMGKNFVLNVTAYSPDNGAITYQWYFSTQKSEDGSAIENATESSYEGSVTKESIGYYWCVVTSEIPDNGDGGNKKAEIESKKVLIEKNIINAVNPIVLKQPESISLNFGERFSLNVIAYSLDNGTLSYQWYKDEQVVEGATSATYKGTVSAGTLGEYYCEVTSTIADNGDGGVKAAKVTTENAAISTVAINAKKPVIQQMPVNVSAEFGKTFTFSVMSHSVDDGILSYQWYKNGEAIDGATSYLYTGVIASANLGNYYCEITNKLDDNGDGGVKIAVEKTETVLLSAIAINAQKPVIQQMPVNITAVYGKSFTLTVVAHSTDGGILSYQWYKDDKKVKNASSSSYTATISRGTLGNYYCEVTNTIVDNGDGGTKSVVEKTSFAIISNNTVNANAPVITQNPTDISLTYGKVFLFTVAAYSTDQGTISYQWYKDESPIEGAVNKTYTNTVSTETVGSYYCKVFNTITDNGDGGKKSSFINSSVVTLSNDKVNVKTPVIISQPESLNLKLGKPFSFSVAAYSNDEGTLSYQWYRNNEPIEGAVASSYSGSVATSLTGSYFCEVTNTLEDNGDGGIKCSSARSETVFLALDVINAVKPVILLQPESVTTAFGNDYSFTVIANTSDGGTLSYKWYRIDDEGEPQEISSANENKFTGIMSAEAAGSYYCVVTNTIEDNGDGGKKSESVRTESVLLAKNMVNALTPVITNQPIDSIVSIPAVKVLSVGAYTFDDGTLSYQWYSVDEGDENSTAIEGATELRYKIVAAEQGKTGYYCVITNTLVDNGDGGVKTSSVRSSTAWVDAVYVKDFVSAPDFTVQPVSMNIAPFNQSIELSCEAETGEGNVSYRWYQSNDGTTNTGTPVAGANDSIFTTPVYTEKGIYYYYCVATNVLDADEKDNIKSAAAISDVVSVAYTGLPTLYLNTEVPTASITKDNYVFGDFKLVTEEFGTTEYSFSKTDGGEKNEGVKGRGNSTWNMPKKGYAIKFDNKQSFFGLAKAKKWCIIANYSDKTLLRNKLASIMGNEIFNTEWTPTFYNVDVVMNGEYMGNYIFCERNTISTGRVDVQDISDCTEKKIKKGSYVEQNGDDIIDLKDGGFIIEIEGNENRAKGEDYYFRGKNSGVFFCLKDPDKVSAEIQQRVFEVVQNVEDVLFSDGFTDEETGWRKYLDESSVIDWYLINEFAKNRDAAFYSSVYMYYNPIDGKLHMGPIWDFDIGFGNDGENDNYSYLGSPNGWRIKTASWISRLFNDENFNSSVQNRWREKKSALTQTFYTDGVVKELSEQISVAAEMNFMKWEILGKYIWPNPSGFKERTTYQSEIEYLLNWLNNRYNWLDGEINSL